VTIVAADRRVLVPAAILLGAAAGLWLWARRGGPGPSGPAPGRVAAVADLVHGGRPVVFVGLDGADWQLLDRFVAAGGMPHLAALAREGQAGVLETLHPPLSPLVWTTMVTGRGPLDHGILDFTRFHPRTGLKEPITSDERREPAVWNMATYAGRRSATFGLWATYPAEPVNGLLVSDRLFSFLYSEEAPPPAAVFPGEREAWARQALEQAEKQIGFAELTAYLPWLSEAEYAERVRAREPYAHPVSALRRILVETRVYHSLATETIARDKPDLTVVYLQGTDSIGHVFAPFAPPRQAEVSEEDYRRYHRVPETYFRHVDALLGEYRRLAEESGAALVVASDHGFLWGEGRPTELSSFAHATAAKWHRNEGIFVLWGHGIAAAGARARGSVEQVAPTLLALQGLPRAIGMAAPLPPIAPAGTSVDYRQHYRPATAALAAAPAGADQEAIERLKALGYIGAGEAGDAPEGMRGTTRTAGSYNNEGLIWKGRGSRDKAVAAFEKALELDPDLASALWNLSDLLFAEGRDLRRADALLVRAFAGGLPEGQKFLIGRAIGYQRSGRPDRSLDLVRAALEARPDVAELWLFSGRYRVETGDCRGAAADFQRAVASTPGDAAAHASLGLAHLCLGQREAAHREFQRSLELDPNQPKVREYLKRF
jgi:tetratricopeptide (TPR) repeat protein